MGEPEFGGSKLKRRLKPNQERALLHYLEHRDATAAGKLAGYRGGGFHALLRRSDIRAMLDSIDHMVLSVGIMAREEKARRLSAFAREDLIDPKTNLPQRNSCIQSIAELNKMFGDYAPEKVDATIRQISIVEVVVGHSDSS